MSAAKRVARAAKTIRARWEQQVSTDPQTEAAQALEDTGQLLDPETAAELVAFRKARVLAEQVAEHGPFPVPVGPQSSERDRLRAAYIAALDEAARTHPCPVTGRPGWMGCVHYDDAGHVSGVGSCHSGRRADAVLVVRDAELDRLRAQVADLNESLTVSAEALRARPVCPCPPADQPGPHQIGCPLAERPVNGLTAVFAPVASLREDDVTPQVRKLRSLLAGRRGVLEDPHDGPLAHTYRVGHDLPEAGGR